MYEIELWNSVSRTTIALTIIQYALIQSYITYITYDHTLHTLHTIIHYIQLFITYITYECKSYNMSQSLAAVHTNHTLV